MQKCRGRAAKGGEGACAEPGRLAATEGSRVDGCRQLRRGSTPHLRIVSPLLLAELERALAYPKLRARIAERDAEAALRWLSRGATIADDPTGEPPLRSEDPGDDYLITLAARERAALVSGDRHLLSLAGQIPVLSPREFVALV